MKQNQLKRRGGPSACFLFWVFLGESWTLLREVLPADNGSSLSVSWSLLRGERGGEVLHYVLEWAGVAVAEPQWKRLAGNQNNASITGTAYLPPRQSWCLCQPGWTRINHILFGFIWGFLGYLQSNQLPRPLLPKESDV